MFGVPVGKAQPAHHRGSMGKENFAIFGVRFLARGVQSLSVTLGGIRAVAFAELSKPAGKLFAASELSLSEARPKG